MNRADRWFAAARECDRILSGIRPMSLRERIESFAEVDHDLDGRPDIYGDNVVSALEERVAELLGKPAAVFFPTGTMTQQVALRIWASETGNHTVALHPKSHPEVHERHALSTLTKLRTVWPTTELRQPLADEVSTLDEPFGTLLLELPLRDAGYLLPSYDELVAVVGAARDRGARVHFDGARLWETPTHFDQPLTTLAELADSVYVSFYKTLGGIAGAALAGSSEFVATARAWRHRYGGNVFQQWPAALAALRGLSQELPRLPTYVEHAKVVAAALASLPGARIHPSPPHTHQFQLLLPFDAEALNEAAFAIAAEEKVWFAGFNPTGPTGYAMAEITVASGALEFTAVEVAALGARVLEAVADRGE